MKIGLLDVSKFVHNLQGPRSAFSVVITRSSMLFCLVGSCTCCERPLSAINCSNFLPGAGVGRCSDQSIWSRLKSPMMTNLRCVRRISSSGGGGGSDGGGVVDGVDSGGGGDFGGEECFDGLFMGLPLEVGGLPHFPTMRVETFWSTNAPVLLC